jgi:hypothetical protein
MCGFTYKRHPSKNWRQASPTFRNPFILIRFDRFTYENPWISGSRRNKLRGTLQFQKCLVGVGHDRNVVEEQAFEEES